MSYYKSWCGAAFAWISILAFGMTPGPAGTAIPTPIPPATEADWAALDVVPMPKHVRRLDSRMALHGPRPAVLALGAAAPAQDRIGADYINRSIVRIGAPPLAIVTCDHIPAGARVIHIGMPASQPAIAAAVAAGTVDVGVGRPGERGYEIRIAGDDAVYLAGADALGSLYACVTFAALLAPGADGVATWRMTEVRDWPDFPAVTLGSDHISSMAGMIMPEHGAPMRHLNEYIKNPNPATRAKYIAACQAQVDLMLRWKISLLHFSQGPNMMRWRNEFWAGPAEVRQTLRETIEYGKARGVGALLYAMSPFAGLRAEHPDAPDDCTDARSARYGAWVRCWSLDDMRREYARELARCVAEAGFTDVGFHDTDTGGYLNPAGWNERCARCRARWGDDYAAASANKARIFMEEFAQAAPDTRVHYTFYPYHCRTVDFKGCLGAVERRYGKGGHVAALTTEIVGRYTDFWARLNALLPKDVFTFVMREDAPAAVARFRELTPGRDILWWEGGLWQDWSPFVHRAPAWRGTFHQPGRREPLYINYTGPCNGFFPVLPLLHMEYAWNVGAPGAEPWSRHEDGAERWRHGEPEGAMFTVVLPHVVRNLFGRELAANVTEALCQNVAPLQLVQGMRAPHHILRDPGTAMLDWQAARAATAAAALDRAWQTLVASGNWLGLGDYELSRLIFLREAMHCAWQVARIRAAENRARDLARANDAPAARAALGQGLAWCDDGARAMAALLAQRPEHLRDFTRASAAGRARGFQVLMAENFGAEAGHLRGLLAATDRKLDAMARLAGVPPELPASLARPRIVRALRAAAAPEVDGVPDEPAWQPAHPVESFLVLNKADAQIAAAHTRVRFIQHGAHLHIGLECEPQPGAVVQSNDTVEIFLMPPDLAGDYIQLFVRADGGLRHQRMRRTDAAAAAEIAAWTRDAGWTGAGILAEARPAARGWTAEIVVPFAALGAQPQTRWKINAGRACPDDGGLTEFSSILSPGAKTFHAPDQFPVLYWTDEVFSPALALEVTAPRRAVRTFSDAIATVIAFGVRAQSNLILHRARMYAEVYDAAGAVRGRMDIGMEPALRYFYETDGLEARYDGECARGGLRVVLEAAEGTAEAWYRFGGWDNARGAGALFAPAPADAAPAPRVDFAAAGACCLPGTAALPAGGRIPLLAERHGTVEFWLRPNWRGAWYKPVSNPEYRIGNHVLLHVGPPARDAGSVNQRLKDAMMVIRHDAADGTLGFHMRAHPIRAGWSRTVKIAAQPAWLPGAWRHVACVWDADAAPENWLRVYIDGLPAGARAITTQPERLGADQAVRYAPPAQYVIQVGAINDGTAAADGLISILRISRVARYQEDFTPPAGPLAPDEHTTALFDFNGGLRGAGMTPDGRLYELVATSGIWEESD